MDSLTMPAHAAMAMNLEAHRTYQVIEELLLTHFVVSDDIERLPPCLHRATRGRVAFANDE
jgi:hypothetical protein